MDSEGSEISAVDASGGTPPAAARFGGMIRLLPYCLSLANPLVSFQNRQGYLSQLPKPFNK
jgi:hypothetical protein